MTVSQGFTVEGDADPEAAFAFAAERGFDYVELNMDYAFERTRVDPADVRALADEHDLDLAVHLPYRLDEGAYHEHVREGVVAELQASVDAAVEMGADRGVMHAAAMAHPEKWTGEEVRPYVYETVRRVDAHARDRDFTVAVENVKGPHFDAGDFTELFAETDARACLDTGHALVAGYDLTWQAAFLREHGDRVAHLHLNTRRGDSGADEHLPVGIGGRPFDELATAIRETGWSGTATHEVFTFDREFVALGKENLDGWLADDDDTPDH
jgi:sugar phosphate isomerase/epimerase